MIGIVQEIRAKRVLDRLTLMNEPKTQVVRSGQMLQVDSEQLVLGDLCVFQAGNQICADAVVEKGSLRVNEALITGEADEVVKIRAIYCIPAVLLFQEKDMRHLQKWDCYLLRHS